MDICFLLFLLLEFELEGFITYAYSLLLFSSVFCVVPYFGQFTCSILNLYVKVIVNQLLFPKPFNTCNDTNPDETNPDQVVIK